MVSRHNHRAIDFSIVVEMASWRDDSPESKLRFATVLEQHAQGLLLDTARKPVEKRSVITANELFLQFVSKEILRCSLSERQCQRSRCRLAALTNRDAKRPADRQTTGCGRQKGRPGRLIQS